MLTRNYSEQFNQYLMTTNTENEKVKILEKLKNFDWSKKNFLKSFKAGWKVIGPELAG